MAVLSYGPLGNDVEQVIRALEQEEPALSVGHYDMRFAKPLDTDILEEVATRYPRIVTVEDGALAGGMGSAVLEWMNDHGYHPAVTRLGLPDDFVEHGTVAELRHIVGLDADSIRKAIVG